jgi:hypothetical protein
MAILARVKKTEFRKPCTTFVYEMFFIFLAEGISENFRLTSQEMAIADMLAG